MLEKSLPNVIFRGDRLRQLRRARHTSADQLARYTGLTVYHIYRLERGDRPHVWGTTVGRLALVLQTTTDYLLNLTDDPQPAPRIAADA
jgi:transcriptional regulator with XRE-family HTH domain